MKDEYRLRLMAGRTQSAPVEEENVTLEGIAALLQDGWQLPLIGTELIFYPPQAIYEKLKKRDTIPVWKNYKEAVKLNKIHLAPHPTSTEQGEGK